MRSEPHEHSQSHHLHNEQCEYEPPKSAYSSKHFYTSRSRSLALLLFDLQMNRMVLVTTSKAGSSNPIQLLFQWTTAAAVGLAASLQSSSIVVLPDIRVPKHG